MTSKKVGTPLHLQLWSYNYAPEPTGIGPVSHTWAKAMVERGHRVSVVAAHPHYPEPTWKRPRRPTRSTEDGVEVIRLPLLVGRESAGARMRQDASFSASLLAALPFLPRADARVVVSPCFPALSCAILTGKVSRRPWLLWIQDILPDGAVSTGLVDEQSRVIKLSRQLECAAYASAARITVISDRFAENLRTKGVSKERLARIYNPATLPVTATPRTAFAEAPRILVMGNIGHSQGLTKVVELFQGSQELDKLGARLIITGTGVAAEEVRAAVSSDRVELRGVVSNAELAAELASASVGLVAQAAELPEFNFPSKLMNYLASALPVAGFVAPDSEVAGVIDQTRTGLVIDNRLPDAFGEQLAALAGNSDRLTECSAAAHRFASDNLTPEALAKAFEAELQAL